MERFKLLQEKHQATKKDVETYKKASERKKEELLKLGEQMTQLEEASKKKRLKLEKELEASSVQMRRESKIKLDELQAKLDSLTAEKESLSDELKTLQKVGESEVKKLEVKNSQLQDKVKILDPMSISEIRTYAAKSTFFIQLSSFEGMAMSVIEAMQYGLIPIVTSVGEISSYCIDEFNSIIYSENKNQETLNKVIQVLDNPEKFLEISSNSIKTWIKTKTYKDDIVDACIKLSKTTLLEGNS